MKLVQRSTKFRVHGTLKLATQNKKVAWPSGLRRWFKAPVSSGAWVRIPPLPNSILSCGFGFKTQLTVFLVAARRASLAGLQIAVTALLYAKYQTEVIDPRLSA